jgi:ABC-type transporter Mla subunit MlaD
MAVSAKFVADFSSFQDAVTKASASLKTFEQDANKVGASLNKMADQFSGKKLIQDATLMVKAIDEIGGVTKLTDKELQRIAATTNDAAEKMRALGIAVPESFNKIGQAAAQAAKPIDAMAAGMSAAGKVSFDSSKIVAGMSAAGKEAAKLTTATTDVTKAGEGLGGGLTKVSSILGAFGISLGIGAIVQFGRSLLADADALQKMSDRTGIGVEGLQRLQIVGDDVGNTIEDMTGAINQMQNRLVSGDKSAVAAMAQLGINMEQFLRLNPDQQFIKISDAIREVQDPAQQVAIAMDLFGKTGAQVLPSLKKGFDDVKDAAVGMSRESVEALDTVGDTLSRWWRQAKGITAEAAVSFAHVVQAGFDPMALGAQNAKRELDSMSRALKEAMAAADKAGPAFKGTAPPGLPEDLEHIYAVLDRQKDAFNAANEAAKKTATETKRLAEEQKKLTDEFAKSADGAHKLEAGFFGLHTAVKEASNSELEWIKRHQQAQTESEKLAEKIREVEQSAHIANFGFQGMADGLDKVGQKADVIPKVTKQLTGMQTVLAELPDLLIKSFTGGGGLTGALEAFSTSITKTLFSAHGAFEGFTKKISGMFGPDGIGGAIGKTLGGLLPGIGALIGPAIEGIKKLFTSAEQAINKTRAAFVDAAGGLDALRDKATAAGTTINKVLDAKNVKQYEAAVRDLNQAFEDQKAEMEDIAGFKDKFASIGGALSDSMREALRGLASIPGLSKDAADALIGMANDTKPNFAELEKKAADLGIDLAALGPIFQQAHVNDQAATLISTFEQLRDAGADVGGVINGMADEINAVVQDSIKFKTDIPENMRWMIEALIASNQLFDEQGQLITDIRDLKFGAPVKTETDKIVDAIKELGEILKKLPTIAGEAAKGMTDELANVHPPAIHVPIVFDWPNLPEGAHAATGGYVTAAGDVQYMAQGSARVLPFRPRGSDTVPAMLTPGEGVLTTAEMRALGGVAGFNTLRRNLQSGGTGSADMSGVESRLDALHQELMADRMNGPQKLARAVRDEVQKARVGRR